MKWNNVTNATNVIKLQIVRLTFDYYLNHRHIIFMIFVDFRVDILWFQKHIASLFNFIQLFTIFLQFCSMFASTISRDRRFLIWIHFIVAVEKSPDLTFFSTKKKTLINLRCCDSVAGVLTHLILNTNWTIDWVWCFQENAMSTTTTKTTTTTATTTAAAPPITTTDL